MTGHTACNGVDGIPHVHSFSLEHVTHLAQCVLGLRDGHPIARHNDDLAGVLHDEGGVVSVAATHGALALGASGTGRAAAGGAEAAKQDVEDRAVHPLAHHVRQDGARRANKRASDNEREVLDGEADAASRPPGVAVQHRDDDRHVGAADRQDQQEAERQGHQRDKPEHDLAAGRHEQDDQDDGRSAKAGVKDVLTAEGQRIALDEGLELGERDERAGEGDGPDCQPDRHLDQALGVDVTGMADAERDRGIECGRGDKHRGQADEGVEGRDELWQRSHLDAPGDDHADRATDSNAQQDQDVALPGHAVTQQGGDDGHRHAGDAEAVAGSRGGRVGKAAQRQDKQDRGDKVGERGQAGGHGGATFGRGTWTACAASR